MRDKLAALIETRKITTFAVVFVFLYMSMSGKLDANFTENVILMVLTYYFAKSTDKT